MEQLSVLMFIRLPSVLIQYEKVCVSDIYSLTKKTCTQMLSGAHSLLHTVLFNMFCECSVHYKITTFSEFTLEWKSPRLSFKGKWFSSFSLLSLYRRVSTSLRLNAQGRTKKERKGDYFLSYKRFRLYNPKYCHLFTFFLIILVLAEYLVKICCTFVL